MAVIPPGLRIYEPTGKRSGGVKKETLQPVPGEAGRAGKPLFPGTTANGNIWVSFSRSEVQPGEEIPSR
ncbi:MAG: hypothetical protein U5K69_28205 [Balneolaceae bacterium]|nr:hypothetical protein [Balneolaceae bacterium]